jgi:hypothetical protein
MKFVAFRDYSKYQVNGQFVVRSFHTEKQAREFVRDLIHWNYTHSKIYGNIQILNKIEFSLL